MCLRHLNSTAPLIGVTSVFLAVQIAATEEPDAAVTAHECREIADRLIQALATYDLRACNQLSDPDAVVERMFEDLEFDFTDKQTNLKKWQSLFRTGLLFGDLLERGGQHESVQCLQIEPGVEPQILLRHVASDGALSYRGLTLEPRSGADPVIARVEVYGGPSYEDRLRTIITRFVPHDGPDGKIDSRAPGAEEKRRDKAVLSAMQTSSSSGDHQTVIARFYQLSPKLRTERYSLLMAIRSSIDLRRRDRTPIPEVETLRLTQHLLNQFRKAFPDDVLTDHLLSFDHYYDIGDFALANVRLNQIERRIGQDPYLDCLRALVSLAEGNADEAETFAAKELESLPQIVSVQSTAAYVALHRRDFERAYHILQEAKAKHDFDLDLNSVYSLGVEAFQKSELYREWRTWKEQRQEAAGGPDE